MSEPSSVEFSPLSSLAELLHAAREEGLRLTTEQTELDASGLDFLVLRGVDESGTAWIVRTPRRREVVAAAAIEARVLRLVAPRLPVAVPEWRVHTPRVIAYPLVEGTPAVTLGDGGPSWNVIDPASLPAAFVEAFARTLAELQAIPDDDARAAGVPRRTIDEVRSSVDTAMHATRGDLEPSDGIWRRWQRWLDDDDAWPRDVALVHGDLHPGHMLLRGDGALAGVLDWTEAQVTDPSIDLAMFFGCFGESALEALLARFEAAGGRTWPGLAHHARERWTAFPALVAEWALRTGNDDALRHARGLLASVS